MNFNNLREIRKTKGFMAGFIANELGIGYRHLARIEIGQSTLTDERAAKLSSIYKLNLEIIKKTFERSAQEFERSITNGKNQNE